MKPKDYYKTLGVAEGAGIDEIKKVYRKLAKQYHPDANPGNKQAEDKFKEVSEAYEVLSDPQKRQQYDQMRKYGFGSPGGPGSGFDYRNFDFGGSGARTGQGRTFTFEGFDGFGGIGDLFAQFFDMGEENGPLFSSGKKNRDANVEIRIPFSLAVEGGKTNVSVTRDKACPVCGGSGAKPGSKASTCAQCGGRGRVTIGQGAFGVSRPCPTCMGSGKIITAPCAQCGGSGRVQGPVTYSVRIPAGIEDGEKIRLRGQGAADSRGRTPGDLILTVRVEPHRFFKCKDGNVHCDVRLTLKQAALGSSVKINTVKGKKVLLKIPAGTQDGTMLRIPKMGIEKNGRLGNQYVTVRVEIPRHPTPEEKELLKRFKQSRDKKNATR